MNTLLSPTSTKTILMVDDDRDVRVGTRLRLQVAGYHTIEAIDGAEGVAMAREHQPDAILMDVRMPRMDGLAALSKLQQCDKTDHIPIVMLSASLVDQTSALDSGARFFLSKPYQGEELLEAIEIALKADCD